MRTLKAVALISRQELRRLNYIQLSGEDFNLTLYDITGGADLRDPSTNRFVDTMAYDLSSDGVRNEGAGVEFSYDGTPPYQGIVANKPGVFNVVQDGPPIAAIIDGVADARFWTLKFDVVLA